MNPVKVSRAHLNQLSDLPNVGPAVASDLRLLGIALPEQLIGQDPYAMYATLCTVTGRRHDPCMIDVFISITRFMAGEAPQAWWKFSAERKRRTDVQDGLLARVSGKFLLDQPRLLAALRYY